MGLAAGIILAGQAWLCCGLLAAFVFLAFGLDRLDPQAHGAYVFRVLLLPGLVMLWPLVLWRWSRIETGRDDPCARHIPPRDQHGRFAALLVAAIPAILLLALLFGAAATGPLLPVKLSGVIP